MYARFLSVNVHISSVKLCDLTTSVYMLFIVISVQNSVILSIISHFHLISCSIINEVSKEVSGSDLRALAELFGKIKRSHE